LLTDQFIIHVDPAPSGLYWNYTVSNSPAGLTINGLVGLAQTDCADVPDKFTHNNVVATLVTPSSIELKAYTQDGPVLVVPGLPDGKLSLKLLRISKRGWRLQRDNARHPLSNMSTTGIPRHRSWRNSGPLLSVLPATMIGLGTLGGRAQKSCHSRI